jgi:hypothetical protein
LRSFKTVPRTGGALADGLKKQFDVLEGKIHPLEFIRDCVTNSTADGPQVSRHIERLWAKTRPQRLASARRADDASKLAAGHQLVTPFSGAVVLETKQQYAQNNLTPAAANTVPVVPEPSTCVFAGCTSPSSFWARDFLYGAAMGWWRDPQQALYVAIKFPLIILLTTAGNALINAMLAPLLGLNIPFRQSFSAILMSFTIAAAILGAFSPLMAFMVWNAPPMSPEPVSGATYNFIKLATSPSSRSRARRAMRACFNCSRGSAAAGPSRVSRAVRVAGGQSVSRQPAFVDSAPVHRLAVAAGGIFPRHGPARKFLRKCFPLLQQIFND